MIEWQPGDTIIMRLNKYTNEEQSETFRLAFQKLFPGCTIVATTGLEGIDVLRKK